MRPDLTAATPPQRDVTLLWALRSPCNLGCRYCYFGTLPEHRENPPTKLGQLSHLSRTDLGLADITQFVHSLADSPVARIFLAGGEPLIWPPVLPLIKAIKEADVELVVCTNGIPLSRPEVVSGLLDVGVDAVSVSLDSASRSTMTVGGPHIIAATAGSRWCRASWRYWPPAAVGLRLRSASIQW